MSQSTNYSDSIENFLQSDVYKYPRTLPPEVLQPLPPAIPLSQIRHTVPDLSFSYQSPAPSPFSPNYSFDRNPFQNKSNTSQNMQSSTDINLLMDLIDLIKKQSDKIEFMSDQLTDLAKINGELKRRETFDFDPKIFEQNISQMLEEKITKILQDKVSNLFEEKVGNFLDSKISNLLELNSNKIEQLLQSDQFKNSENNSTAKISTESQTEKIITQTHSMSTSTSSLNSNSKQIPENNAPNTTPTNLRFESPNLFQNQKNQPNLNSNSNESSNSSLDSSAQNPRRDNIENNSNCLKNQSNQSSNSNDSKNSRVPNGKKSPEGEDISKMLSELVIPMQNNYNEQSLYSNLGSPQIIDLPEYTEYNPNEESPGIGPSVSQCGSSSEEEDEIEPSPSYYRNILGAVNKFLDPDSSPPPPIRNKYGQNYENRPFPPPQNAPILTDEVYEFKNAQQPKKLLIQQNVFNSIFMPSDRGGGGGVGLQRNFYQQHNEDIPPNSHSDRTIYGLSTANLSFATREYLERHGLVSKPHHHHIPPICKNQEEFDYRRAAIANNGPKGGPNNRILDSVLKNPPKYT